MSLHLFDKVVDLKDKFKKFFFHRKQLLALENYADVVPFQHKDYLILIKRCMKDGFLGIEEADFLVHMINKYFSNQNFLDWTHRTRWLKSEINRLQSNYIKPKVIQTDMFDAKSIGGMAAKVPMELLAAQQKSARVARR